MFLVLVFLFSAGLLFCLEVEFLALSFIIVYVGAIAVLFLFVVMMLDIKVGDNSLGFLNYGPISYFVTFLFLLEITIPLIKGVTAYPYGNLGTEYVYINWFNQIDFITNLEAIGQLLYTYYFVFFLMSGFILFVAMLGAIMLTLTLEKSVKKQIVYKQLSRHNENAFLNQSK
jgi:NADH-quinone oxidoreductase subunit J